MIFHQKTTSQKKKISKDSQKETIQPAIKKAFQQGKSSQKLSQKQRANKRFNESSAEKVKRTGSTEIGKQKKAYTKKNSQKHGITKLKRKNLD